MANLIQSIELKPQKETKLQNHLFTEIKNQQKWRNNRSDAFNDQLKFYESYFGNSSYIEKSIMQRFLEESENINNENLNFNSTNKTKFLELAKFNSEFNTDSNNDSVNQILFSFDNDDKEFEAFNFSIKNKKSKEEGNDTNNSNFSGK